MRLLAVPETWLERLAAWFKIAPIPICDTHMAFMLARTIMVGAKTGVFEALSDSPQTATQVATQCNTDAKATLALLNTLVHLGYVQLRRNQYRLSSLARQWMLPDSDQSLHDKMLLQFLEWEFVEHYETYLRTGHPLNYHATMNESQWSLYQRGMRSVAEVSVKEIGKRTPVPKQARRLLDIGGAHSIHAAVLCRNHPNLKATILDLPEALESAQKMSEGDAKDERITFMPGDALTKDLGEEVWDVVFTSSLAHHLNDEDNRALTERVARSLRPGGCYIVQDFIRIDKPRHGDHVGGLFNLYFAATSQAGTYSEAEIHQWQSKAGLVPQKSVWLRTIPRHAQIIAKKV